MTEVFVEQTLASPGSAKKVMVLVLLSTHVKRFSVLLYAGFCGSLVAILQYF